MKGKLGFLGWQPRPKIQIKKQGRIMKYLCAVTLNDILTEWANREKREVFDLRAGMILRLPLDTQWFRAELSKQDLPSLRLIRYPSWDDVSCGTGDIEIAAKNVEIFSKVRLRAPNKVSPSERVGQDRQESFHRLVDELVKFRQNAGQSGHNLTLILVTSSRTKPATILEGNHTAIALYFRYFIDHKELVCPNLNAFVGISVNMCRYPWFRAT
jgi:hypothetical protein